MLSAKILMKEVKNVLSTRHEIRVAIYKTNLSLNTCAGQQYIVNNDLKPTKYCFLSASLNVPP